MSKEAPQLDDSVRSARAIGDIRTEHAELFTETPPDTRSPEQKALDAATDPHAKPDGDAGADKGAAKDAGADAGADAGDGKDKGEGADAGADAGDDKDKGGKGGGEAKIPKARFDEVVQERNREREQREKMAQQLRERDERDAAAAKAAEDAKKDPPRDWDKEFDAIEEEYEGGTLSEREYRTKIRKLEQARVDAKAEELIRPVLEKEAQREEREALEEVNTAIDAAAKKLVAEYPALDHLNEKTRNVEAINEVVAERNQLLELGIEPAKALKMATAVVVEKYKLERVEPKKGETEQERVQRERREAAARTAAGAAAIPPDPKQAGGQGQRSVREADPIETMTPKQWAALTPAQRDEYLGKIPEGATT